MTEVGVRKEDAGKLSPHGPEPSGMALDPPPPGQLSSNGQWGRNLCPSGDVFGCDKAGCCQPLVGRSQGHCRPPGRHRTAHGGERRPKPPSEGESPSLEQCAQHGRVPWGPGDLLDTQVWGCVRPAESTPWGWVSPRSAWCTAVGTSRGGRTRLTVPSVQTARQTKGSLRKVPAPEDVGFSRRGRC